MACRLNDGEESTVREEEGEQVEMRVGSPSSERLGEECDRRQEGDGKNRLKFGLTSLCRNSVKRDQLRNHVLDDGRRST